MAKRKVKSQKKVSATKKAVSGSKTTGKSAAGAKKVAKTKTTAKKKSLTLKKTVASAKKTTQSKTKAKANQNKPTKNTKRNPASDVLKNEPCWDNFNAKANVAHFNAAPGVGPVRQKTATMLVPLLCIIFVATFSRLIVNDSFSDSAMMPASARAEGFVRDYMDDSDTAVVCDRIVRQGDMVAGARVLEVDEDCVELEVDGKIITVLVRKKQDE